MRPCSLKAAAAWFPATHCVSLGHPERCLLLLQPWLQGELGGGDHPLNLLHGNAERTGLPADSADLVTLCLVAHELPADATRAVFREAHRLLRPGGALAVMEVRQPPPPPPPHTHTGFYAPLFPRRSG